MVYIYNSKIKLKMMHLALELMKILLTLINILPFFYLISLVEEFVGMKIKHLPVLLQTLNVLVLDYPKSKMVDSRHDDCVSAFLETRACHSKLRRFLGCLNLRLSVLKYLLKSHCGEWEILEIINVIILESIFRMKSFNSLYMIWRTFICRLLDFQSHV